MRPVRPVWRNRGWTALAGAVLAVAVSACSDPKGIEALPPPPTTQPPKPTTTLVDYSRFELKGVAGRTTTTLQMGPGGSTLNGVVASPEGAVPGATVLVERLVGDNAASVQVLTGPDGRWTVPAVLGGRFRVRAWRSPDLAMTKPEIFFLNDGDAKQLQLNAARYTGLAVTHAIAPNPPVVDEPANLVVQVVQQSVDVDGIVRGTPVPNARAELFGGGEWSVVTSNPTTTDAQGRAQWQLRCRATGKQQLGAVIANQQQFPLDLPPCAQGAPVEETSTTSSSTTSTSTTSTTTEP